MKIELLSLDVSNFKGIKHFSITPNGGNLKIKGKNERGKTTLYDSFLWLLFGQNSAGETKFGIKPNGAPDEIEPTVTATLKAGEKEIELKKVLAAKFEKDTHTFKENKTECYINGVKKGVKEYETYIAEICGGEQKFKMLTNPRYFCEKMEWKERRKILFDVCGALNDEEIIAQHEELVPLKEKIAKHGTIDEYTTYLLSESKNIAKQINDLPTRIDEIYKQTAGTTINIDEIKKALEKAREEKEQLQKEKIAIENGTAGMQLQEKINKLESAKNELIKKNFEYRNSQSLEQTTSRHNAKMDLETEFSKLNSDFAEKRAKYKMQEAEIAKLRNEYIELLNSAWDGNEICPTCGQAIPQEKIEASKAAFNEKKSNAISENTAKGKKIKAEMEMLAEEIKALTQRIAETKNKIEEIGKTEIVVKDIDGYSEQMKKLEMGISALKQEQEKIKTDIAPKIAEITEKIKIKQDEILKLEQSVATAAQKEAAEERLSELKTAQKKLAALQGENKRMLDLIADFTRLKVKTIEENINNRFEYVKFKLFTQNITDGKINEACEPIANNAPNYSDINNAGKILAGFDVIKALQKHYDFYPPVFVDNLDALDSGNKDKIISMFADTAQVITLMVSDDETLTIE